MIIYHLLMESITHTITHTISLTHTHIQVHHQKEEPGHVEATPINTNPHTRIRESTMNLVTDKKLAHAHAPTWH
jgi:hypothetical protein